MEKRRQARHRNYLLEDRERDDSLVQMNYAFLKATGEQAELEHEARSTALAVAHLGTGQSCLTAGQNKGAVGAPENNLHRISLSIRDASSYILLEASVFGNRDCADRR